jgi:hypothetical protein
LRLRAAGLYRTICEKERCMMSMPAKIFLFVIFNAIGYYLALTVVTLLLKAEMYPISETAEVMKRINFYVFGIGTWVWLACAVTSVGVFWGDGPRRMFLLALPVLLPTLYVIGAVLWFKAHTA